MDKEQNLIVNLFNINSGYLLDYLVPLERFNIVWFFFKLFESISHLKENNIKITIKALIQVEIKNIRVDVNNVNIFWMALKNADAFKTLSCAQANQIQGMSWTRNVLYGELNLISCVYNLVYVPDVLLAMS